MSDWFTWILVTPSDQTVLALWRIATMLDAVAALLTFAAALKLGRLNGAYAHRLGIGLGLIAAESVTAALTVPILLSHFDALGHQLPYSYELVRCIGRAAKAGGQWLLALYFLGLID